MSSPSDETHLAETGLQSGSDAQASHPSAASGSRPGWLSSGSGPSGEALAPGALLAERYRILGLVGRGGMGEVYRAEDLRLGQSVALKFLPPAVAEDPQRLAQFHHEVRIARQVSHRNVCRVYDIGEDHGRVFLTMELIDGEDLAGLLKRVGRFPEERATEIARQICAGLAAAHDCGVLHRDLKPANIMLDADGRVRITDFGLAGLAGSFTDIRSGTPGLHGARAARRQGGLGAQRHLLARPGAVRDLHRQARLRRHDDRRAAAPARRGRPSLRRIDGAARRRRRARHPALPRARIRRRGRRARSRCPRRCPAAILWPPRSPPARRRRRRWSPRPAASEAVPLAYGLSLLAFVIVCFGGLVALREATAFFQADAACRCRRPCSRTAPARCSIASATARRRPTPSSQLYVGDDYVALGPAAAAGAALEPAGVGPRAGRRLLVSHQPASAGADPGLDAADADRSAAAHGRHDLRRRRTRRGDAARVPCRAAAAYAGDAADRRRT